MLGACLIRRLVVLTDRTLYRLFAGFEWVGWQNSSTDGTVLITFEFDEVRNFSEVIIHTNNNRREEIEVCIDLDMSTSRQCESVMDRFLLWVCYNL